MSYLKNVKRELASKQPLPNYIERMKKRYAVETADEGGVIQSLVNRKKTIKKSIDNLRQNMQNINERIAAVRKKKSKKKEDSKKKLVKGKDIK